MAVQKTTLESRIGSGIKAMHKVHFVLATFAASAFLAGCSSTGGGDAGGSGPSTVGGLSASAALSAYSPTYAGSTTLKSAEADGLEGYGVDSSDGKFATTRVTRHADALTLQVAGETYVLDAAGSQELAPGITGRVYGDFDSNGIPSGDAAAMLSGQYNSLTVLTKNVRNNGTTADGYAVSVTGLQTPAAGIPNQEIAYEGVWMLADKDYGADAGAFSAIADFNAGDVNFELVDADKAVVGSAGAAIQGSQFHGTMNVSGAGSSKLIGGFYGPRAEEIAGASTGANYTAILSGKQN
jgi:hypothetical protein